MRVLQLHLYLLMWSQAAETFTNQHTDLGQNVTINCNLGEKEEVFWFLLKPESSVLILRTFSNTQTSSDHFHYNQMFTHKYSVKTQKHLFIINVTTDELGVYYCMSTDSDPRFSNGTRLYIIEPTPVTELHNHTVVKYIQQTSWQIFTLISGLLNAVLVVVIIGQWKFRAVRNNSSTQQLHNTDLQQTQVILQNIDPNQSQDPEDDTSSPYSEIHPVPVNSPYVTVQLPKS